jgi:hypothetical protein
MRSSGNGVHATGDQEESSSNGLVGTKASWEVFRKRVGREEVIDILLRYNYFSNSSVKRTEKQQYIEENVGFRGIFFKMAEIPHFVKTRTTQYRGESMMLRRGEKCWSNIFDVVKKDEL